MEEGETVWSGPARVHAHGTLARQCNRAGVVLHYIANRCPVLLAPTATPTKLHRDHLPAPELTARLRDSLPRLVISAYYCRHVASTRPLRRPGRSFVPL